MKRSALAIAAALCAGLGIACGGTDRDAIENNEFDIAASRPVMETGCLTASGDRFVLTALEDDGETELYQLHGAEDALRGLVGREVRVTGDAEPAQVAQIQQPGASGAVGTSGAADGDAEVRTETEVHVETRHMRVVTATATGDECASSAAAQ